MRVLSIDGGGIRGLIPVLVLAEIERRTGRRVCRLFDLIAGTSTGGILACALTCPDEDGEPRLTAEEIAGLYVEEGPRIFHRDLLRRITTVDGLIEERYDDDGLRAALRKYLGETRLKEALTPVFVTAYEIEDRLAFFFRSSRAAADPAYDFSMVEAAHATSAAPTYFEPVQVTDAAGDRTYALIDGGVYAVNPAMCAFAELARADRSIELMLSLGTGSLQRPLRFESVEGWGQLQWARPVLDVVFDGMADTVDFQLGQLLPDGGYVRLQQELCDARDDMDDASPGNLAALRREAERLIAARSADIDAVCERLATPR